MKILSTIASILLLVNFASSQQNNVEDDAIIRGIVIDEMESGLPYASIAVYNSNDSSLVNGAASADNGKFIIKVPSGNYFLEVSFLSYETVSTPSFTLNGSSGYNIGSIILSKSSEIISEVEVVEKASYLKLEVDKKVFVVGSDISNSGGNAADILSNVPSVDVDIEGNISLRGSENVRILIDGKPSGLTGISGNDALRHLQGNLIEKIEVITNPSSKYDAEGEVGIINLVLKKIERQGFNGSFEAGIGYHHNYSASFNINYRKKVYNLFASYGINYRESPGSGFSNQVFTFPDTSFAYNSDRMHTRGGLGNNLRVGSDIFLNSMNTITAGMTYSYADANNKAEVIYSDLNSDGDVFRRIVRNDNENETKQNIEFDVLYEKRFEEKDRKFSIDFMWDQGDDTEKSNITEISDFSTETLFQRSSNIEDQREFILSTDYIHPLGESGKFEIGARAGIRRIINDYLVEEQNNLGEWDILDDFNNEFRYDENIYAGYVSYANKAGNFKYQLGLRSEYSDIKTDLVRSEDVNKRDYIDFFPSAHFSYEMAKMNTIQLSYSRRISRPNFRYLLPFFSFSNPRNFFGGNPELDPEYTNSYEAGYLKRFKKGSLLFNVYYRDQKQVIQRYTISDTLGNTTMFPINAGEQDDIGIEANLSYQLADWWRINAFVNYYYFDLKGSYEGQNLASSGSTSMLRGNSTFNIMKKVDLQTSIRYRAPRENIQGRSKSSYSIDLGASMDVLKGNGTLTLSGKDLFNTRKRRSVTIGENFETESEFQWRSRQIDLSFIYRVNQKKSRGGNRGGQSGDSDMGF